MADLHTGTVTLLFTDIEGSTRLLQRLGEQYTSVLAECRQLLRKAFAQWQGQEVDTQGDAFFVVFARASDAVGASVAIQQTLAAHTWPRDAVVRVRIGLHTGEPQLTTEGYVGLDVHHAARIMSAGHGGQILLSQATSALAEQTLPEGVELQDLGEHRLKDLQRPSHLFQLNIAGLPTDFPPLKTLDVHPHNLPVEPTLFIGRQQEVVALSRLLSRPEVRLVTLTGPGGIGKTRLSLHVAAELSDHFADGVFFVALAMVSEAEQVVPTIVQMLGIREAGGQALLALLKTFLEEKQMLLLLDNFEQVIEASLQVAELLAACPKLKIMVTSRVVLHLQAEHEYPVPPLSLPDPERLPDLVTLSQCEAVALFIARAQAVKPDFAVTNANAPAVAAICVRLDGLPLAIVLAAARVKFFPPQTLLTRLEQGLALLTGGARDLPARQQTLRGAIAWSYNLLSPQEQQLFRRLSVFVNGCTVESAEVVCRAAGELKEDMLDGLLSLVDKSLLRQRESTEGEPRFWTLQMLREFGLEVLMNAEESEVTRRAHAEYFLAVAEQAEPDMFGPNQVRWLERLEQEHHNLRAVLGWTREQHEWEWGLRLASALRRFWETHCYLSEGRQWLEMLLAKEHSADPALRAKALGTAGRLAKLQGDYGHARSLVEESLVLFRKLEDKGGIVWQLGELGSLARYQGDYGQARALIEERLTLVREHGDTFAIANALGQLGTLARLQGDYSQARSLLEESLALFREQRDKAGIAYTLGKLGTLVLVQGDYIHARSLLKESLALFRELENSFGIALTLGKLGILAQNQGDYGQAKSLLEESLALFRELEDKIGIAWLLSELGTLARLQGDYGQARSLLEESLALRRELGDKMGIASCLEGLAEVAMGQGDPGRAARLFGAAEAVRLAIGAPLPLIQRVPYEQAVASVRAQLGQEAFEAAWAEGQTMSLEQAIHDSLKREDEAA
jgi:predicted ATPase/class 3 adenylate cyclase/uncharacterized protein HemY